MTEKKATPQHSKHPYPIHGWLGIVMAIFAWIGNWTFLGLRTHILFFPQWLGFILLLDGLVFKKRDILF